MQDKIVQGSLITTFRCNAKCNMCNIWQCPTKPSEEIDASYYEKLPAGLRINITGGEATIRQDIDKIFEVLYPKSVLLELSTNGYNTKKIVELANKYPKILIRVSVEGLPRINDEKRGLKDGFDHALRTMLELKKTKCKNIGFSVVISPDNYKDFSRFMNSALPSMWSWETRPFTTAGISTSTTTRLKAMRLSSSMNSLSRRCSPANAAASRTA